jgi:iron complex transport system ATP-binding protein
VSPPLLALSAICYRYPEAPAAAAALRDVSLELSPGEVLGLVGPNAAGKSTLLRLAAGLLMPQAGEARLDGRPLRSLGRHARARAIAFLGQHQPDDLPFSALEVALMGRAPHLGPWALEAPGDLACAREALAELDAAALADRPVGQLSGGERQRVFVARALAQQARLLLFDEPLQALDLAHQLLVVRAVRRRADAAGAALLVLHDLSLAAAVCDRLALLGGGRLLCVGSPAEVLQPGPLSLAYGAALDVARHPDTGQLLVSPRLAR